MELTKDCAKQLIRSRRAREEGAKRAASGATPTNTLGPRELISRDPPATGVQRRGTGSLETEALFAHSKKRWDTFRGRYLTGRKGPIDKPTTYCPKGTSSIWNNPETLDRRESLISETDSHSPLLNGCVGN